MNYQKISKASDIEDKSERYLYRFFEMLPGLLSWGTLLSVIVLSFIYPLGVAIFIIVFDVYWLVKTLYLTLHMRIAFSKMRKNIKIDWKKRLSIFKSWKNIHHLIILPTYNESSDVIDDAIASLANSNYPKRNMIVVLAQEARMGTKHNADIARSILGKYKNIFRTINVTEHKEQSGEVAGKGSNSASAGRYAIKKIIDPLKIPHENVIVSVFDVDTVVFPEYFGRLTYLYSTVDDPQHTSYQPIPFYTNNIWEAPAFARVVAFSSTFWQTIQQERIENLITFSSHSMPLTALIDIGFWQKNVVSEDSRIFWQGLLRYDGNYRVKPMLYPVSMDANVAPSTLETMKNIYKQHRRWGYGVENVPYFLFGFIKNKKIALSKKISYSLRVIEGFWSWATNVPLIFLLGWLPLIVGGALFNQTVLAANLPTLVRIIMSLAMLGVLTTAALSMVILPPRPSRHGKFKYVWMLLQWILLPLTLIVFGAIPGLDAQTRLMLGKYMGFWVTPKDRSSPQTHRRTGKQEILTKPTT